MSLSRLLLCACVLTAALAPPAAARERDPERREPRGVERGLRDGRGEAPAAIAARLAVQANGGGRVLSVDRENGGFKVKVLKEGEVRTHFISLE